MAIPRTLTRMQARRESWGLSQSDLANDPQVRIGQWFISLIERGRGIPDSEQAERLARRLGLKAEDLLKPVVVDEHANEPASA